MTEPVNQEYSKPEFIKDKSLVIIDSSLPDNTVTRNEVKKGIISLKEMGFKVFDGEYVYKEYPYTKEGYKQRAAVINAAFANKEVGGIICKSGGYGSTEVMEYLNDKAIQENPKLLCGYSDSTYLLLYIHDRLKMVVFHGPSLISGLAAMANMTKKYFVRVFAQNNYPLKIPMLSFQSWNSGKATGKVIGGNINKLLEYLDAYPDTSFKGKILFIEEFAETPARLGTLFYKLKKRGVFKGIKGILIGRFLDSNSKAMEEEDIKLAKNYLLHHLGDRNIPVLYGFMSGHGWEKVPLPFGTDVTIDATNRLVIYEECPFKEF